MPETHCPRLLCIWASKPCQSQAPIPETEGPRAPRISKSWVCVVVVLLRVPGPPVQTVILTTQGETKFPSSSDQFCVWFGLLFPAVEHEAWFSSLLVDSTKHIIFFQLTSIKVKFCRYSVTHNGDILVIPKLLFSTKVIYSSFLPLL